MQNAVVAVPTFEVEVKLRFILGRWCELDAPLDELLDGRRAALGQDVYGFFFAEAGASFERVCDMEFKFVCLFGYSSDSTLCVV